MEVKRYSVYWVDLNPTRGAEINKIRPCVVVSPDELNAYLRTVIVVPLTTAIHPYPWRPTCQVDGKEGAMALDQLRTVSKERLVGFCGKLREEEVVELRERLREMFA